MHNPFPFLSPRLLNAFLKARHRYFIRQTYQRGIDDGEYHLKGAFLLSHYSEKGRAEIHFEALKNDRHRFFYDITEEGHLQKLEAAAMQPAGYKIYVPLLLQEWTPPRQIAGKVRKYVDEILKWQPGRDDAVKTTLFVQFGELFITLKMRIHEVKIPLSDIERL